MGLDALAVVDPQLRVHGIEGLRIADASVMPAVPSGNCHSGIVMIGEKLADMVKAARQGTVAAPAVAQTRPAVAIHHISLTCRDQAVTERWYTEHFGFRRSRVVQLGPDNRIVFLQGPGVHLELFQATEDAPIDPPTGDGYPWPSVRNFSFTVDHVDEKLAALGDAVEVAFGPMSFDDFVPGWRSAWLRDPDGNLVQITHGYVDEANPPEPPAA
jgi:glyoxylase I family protein